ncbi:MAG: carboxypeptidase regulatory-like domain-containing protein [Deltaproteobacteria bacterium]|nr:carboxypeptidase regulatory-like domain-containing protein [Deltaproteobacteria bacterium]
MRRSHLVVGGVVALIVALLFAWKLRGSSDDSADSEGGAGGASSASGGGTGNASGRSGRTGTTPGSIGGRVTRAADGGPVVGATIAVSRDAVMPMMGTDEEAPSALATTDANGAWSIASIAGGQYSVGAMAAGLQPGSQLHVSIASGTRTTVDLALAAGGIAVTGTVSDIGGGPIGGARVTARKSSELPFGGRPEHVAMTGPDGKYALSLADGDYGATARHDDYTKDSKSFEIHGSPIVVDFKLSPGSGIRGIVVTREGKPVPGAHVTASTGRVMRDGGASATADDKGEFTLTSLGSGAVKLRATGKGFASNEPTVVELGIGEHLEGVRIVVDVAFSISGRVVRAGKPAEGIAGVMLGCFSIGTGQAEMASDPSDDTGAFEIWGVKPASYMMFAIGKDAIPEIGKPVEVVDKDVTDIVIEMATGATLTGRVEPGMISSIGLEVDESKIGIANMFDAMKVMIVRGETDASGVFTLKGAPPGEMSIVATTVDGRKGKLAIVVTGADQTGLIVKLEPRASIAGKVVDEKGAAVAGVHVKVSDEDKSGGGFSMGGFGRQASALTAADGTFKLVGLEPGKLKLNVTDEHGLIPFARGDKRAQALEVSKAQQMTGVELVVEARDGVIRGLVIGADRQPVADAWVSVRRDVSAAGGKQDRADMMAAWMDSADPILTGADGKFTIDKLRRGTYAVTVEGPKGGSRASKPGVKTGDTVTLVLEPLGSLTGRVLSGTAPVTEYDLGCRGTGPGMRFDSDGFGGRRFANADGSYTLERLAPGEYTCTVTSKLGTASGKAVIATGPTKLDFTLVAFASVTGTVVDATTGKPLAGMMVLVSAEGLEGKGFAEAMTGKAPTTDAGGKFVIEGVPAGKGQVHVAPKDATFNHLATRDYTATSGQRVDLGTIKLVPPRTGEPGTLGFFAAVTDDKLMIVDVKDDSPASKAGVVEGDRILAIDGKPVADLGVDVAKQMVSPGSVPTGQPMALTLERAGKQVAVSLVAEPF